MSSDCFNCRTIKLKAENYETAWHGVLAWILVYTFEAFEWIHFQGFPEILRKSQNVQGFLEFSGTLRNS